MRARVSRELGIALAGFAAVLFLQFFRLAQVPGLHFDEAWAYRHAARLADGAFTWDAMSPYTMPWAHYFGAGWLKLFGLELGVFRASQAALSVAGLGFCALALRGRAGAFLPWAAFFLPGLVLNHRFFVELNGWHVLCFGLGLWALVTGRVWLVACAWVAGTTSHLLFYPWGAALLGAAWLSGRELSARERWAAGLGALVLTAFFFRVYLGVPEKDKAKALALLLSGAGLGLHGFWLSRFPRRWDWAGRWLPVGLSVVAAPFLVNLLFFAEGSWNYAIQTGVPIWRHTFYLLFLGVPLIGYMAWRGWREFSLFWRLAFLLGVIGLGALMLKPAPRYFETALLALAAFVGVGVARLRPRLRVLTVGALALHALLLYPSYFWERPVETELRLAFFKDSSRDFLSKQTLARVLGGRGCALSDIKSVDSRVGEALGALALSPADWPVSAASGPCPWPGGLVVERRAESAGDSSATAAAAAEEVADFRLR